MPELMWDGKYDKDGRRAAPPRIALPFQTVETVNESAQERQRTLDLFSSGRDLEWRNRLIWGDNKYILSALAQELSGQIDLMYVDPPFATGQDFSFRGEVNGEEFIKQPSVIEQKAYRDTWGRGLDSFLAMLYPRFSLMRELLTDRGLAFVHMGWEVSHHVKIVLDDVFGRDRFINQIIWKRQTAHSDIGQGSQHLGPIHDVIFLYAKGESFTWNMQYTPYSEEYVSAFYKHVDPETGRRYRLSDTTGPGGASKGNPYYEFLGVSRHWRFSRDRMEELYHQGRIVQTRPGTVPQQKRYLDEMPGVAAQDLWIDVAAVQPQSFERTGYATQKPETLLERIIKLGTSEGDLVMDFFSGSGTTAVVAEKLGRRWIAADLSRFAIHTTRKRLLSIPNVRPFVVQNLGKYERQAWQVSEFGEGAELRYRRFILDLYKAQPLSGYVWLHGIRGGTFIHVGSVDAPVTVGDVRQIVLEHRRAIGTGADAPTTSRIDLLGWDFAFELNEVAKQQAALANVDFHFVRIPREVLEKRAVEQGDIAFYELAALAVDVRHKDRTVTLELTDFVIPLDDVPDDVQRAVTHWTQWIDYWAVDWDNNDDTFHNQWQTYRTRKDPSLQKSAAHSYDEAGCYTIVVKVIDILGNDTTKTLTVEVS